MTEYISREEVLKIMEADIKLDKLNGRTDWRFINARSRSISLIKEVPASDVVEVVRCKSCKYYDNSDDVGWCWKHSRLLLNGDWTIFDDDDYCSYGERRDSDGTGA